MSATEVTTPRSDADAPVRRRRLRRWLLLAVASAMLVAAADGLLAAADLRAAELAAKEARAHLSGGNVDDTLAAAERAVAAANRAAWRTDRLHWRAAARLPLAGPSVEVVRSTASLGASAGDLADELVRSAEPLLAGDAAQLLEEGRLDLTRLAATSDRLSALSVDELTAAHVRLAATADRGPTLRSLEEVREGALETTTQLLDGVATVQETAALATSMLGADGPRRYLLAVQNPGELRGTGGLIGFLAVLELDDGAVTLADPAGVDATNRIDGTVLLTTSRFSRNDRFSLAGPPDYERRYAELGGASFLPSTNIDPDLPTVAPLVLEQYAQASGDHLDGLIAIDPIGLQLIQATIGPLDVPTDVAGYSDQLPDPIPADELAQTLLVDSYEVLGGGSQERRRYQAEVAGAALAGVLSGDWRPAQLAGGMTHAIASRHLQLHSTDPDDQAAIERLGAGGAMAAQQPGDDLLAVTATNIAGNKADVHVAHTLEHELTLVVDDQDGVPRLVRRSTSRFAITNEVDPDADRYISTSLLPRHVDEERQFDDRLGLVNTWVTLWSPAAARLDRAGDLDGTAAHVSTGQIHDLRTIDRLVETPNHATTGMEIALTAPTGVALDGDEATYGLTLWRQAKAVADDLELSLTAPPGWVIRDASLTGGGPALGLGPGGYREPLTLTTSEDAVEVAGSFTADARLEVTLARD